VFGTNIATGLATLQRFVIPSTGNAAGGGGGGAGVTLDMEQKLELFIFQIKVYQIRC
jgi:hypothetical protein